MSTSGLSGLKLILTSGCNMRCSYCYQTARAAQHMSWRTMRLALDLALRSPKSRFSLLFYGGEPLLCLAHIRRAVTYLASRASPGKRFEFQVVTNGLLLKPEAADFLEEHDFTVILSFDGPSAQDARRTGSFHILHDLIQRLRVRNPRLFRDSLTVCITLIPSTIQHLADSVEYFIGSAVQRIGFAPAITHFPEWNDNRIAELESQFERIYRISVEFRKTTGQVPFLTFRPSSVARRSGPSGPECGAAALSSPTVDVDGRIYACPLFAQSIQGGEVSSFLRAAELRPLGRIEDSRIEAHLAALGTAAIAERVFSGRRLKQTGFGPCSDCEYLDRCTVCPLSAAYIPSNCDPCRISDFACAVTRVGLKYHDLMPLPENRIDPALERLREWLAGAKNRAVRTVRQDA